MYCHSVTHIGTNIVTSVIFGLSSEQGIVDRVYVDRVHCLNHETSLMTDPIEVCRLHMPIHRIVHNTIHSDDNCVMAMKY